MAIYGPYYAGSVSYGITNFPLEVLGPPDDTYGYSKSASINFRLGDFSCAVDNKEILTGMRVVLYAYLTDGLAAMNRCYPEWYDAFNESWTYSNFLIPSPLITTTPGSVTLGTDATHNYDGTINDLNDPGFGLYFEVSYTDPPTQHIINIDAVELKIYTDGSLEPADSIAQFRRHRSFRGG